jgi:hypothetical protein
MGRSGRTTQLVPGKPENLEQRALFEEYVKLGSKRSLKQLIPLTDKSWETIQVWSQKFTWVKRAREEDAKMIDNISLESPKENYERRKLILSLINKMIKDVAKLDESGNVIGSNFPARNVFDLRTLIELRDEQLGVKDKSKITPNGGTTNIDKAVFIIKK